MTDLLETLQGLCQHYEDNREQIEQTRQEELVTKRNQACLEASQAILENYESRLKEEAALGRRQAKIFSWKFSDKLQFNECYLRDLLNRGDLMSRLQETLDTRHGPGNFLIHHYINYRAAQSHGEDDIYYVLSISWDTDKFDELRKRTNQTAKTDRNLNHNHRNRPNRNQRNQNQSHPTPNN